jgi:all-trans-retinol dehydrogenase (NAD+)
MPPNLSDLSVLLQEYGHQLLASWKLGCWLGLPWITYKLNRYLSYRAMNNGVSASFDWSKEIVLVTGGSNGIGAACAQQLASGGTRVVVLDVLPLSYDAREK